MKVLNMNNIKKSFGENEVLKDISLSVERGEVVAVIGNLAVFRCHDKFKFVDIHCICEVIVDCETILSELLESKSECGRC